MPAPTIQYPAWITLNTAVHASIIESIQQASTPSRLLIARLSGGVQVDLDLPVTHPTNVLHYAKSLYDDWEKGRLVLSGDAAMCGEHMAVDFGLLFRGSILVFIAPKCFWNDPAEILGACSLLAQSAAGRRATTVNEVNEIRRNTELFRAAYQRKEIGTGADPEQRERDDASEQREEHAELALAKQRAKEQAKEQDYPRLEEHLGDEEVETGRLRLIGLGEGFRTIFGGREEQEGIDTIQQPDDDFPFDFQQDATPLGPDLGPDAAVDLQSQDDGPPPSPLQDDLELDLDLASDTEPVPGPAPIGEIRVVVPLTGSARCSSCASHGVEECYLEREGKARRRCLRCKQRRLGCTMSAEIRKEGALRDMRAVEFDFHDASFRDMRRNPLGIEGGAGLRRGVGMPSTTQTDTGTDDGRANEDDGEDDGEEPEWMKSNLEDLEEMIGEIARELEDLECSEDGDQGGELAEMRRLVLGAARYVKKYGELNKHM